MDLRSRSRSPLRAEKPQLDDMTEQLVKVHFDLDSWIGTATAAKLCGGAGRWD
jgi:hypothetical protein